MTKTLAAQRRSRVADGNAPVAKLEATASKADNTPVLEGLSSASRRWTGFKPEIKIEGYHVRRRGDVRLRSGMTLQWMPSPRSIDRAAESSIQS